MGLRWNFTSHPSEEALENYALRRLPEEQIAALEEHLLVCPSCLAALQQTDQVIDWIKASASSPAPAARTSLWQRLREAVDGATLADAAWIASLAAVCLVLMISSSTLVELGPAAPVTLASLRGAGAATSARAPAQRPLDLTIDALDVPPTTAYRLDIVDAIGRQAWSGSLAFTGGSLSAHVDARLIAGMYWVRLYTKDGELLREFGLQLE